MPKYISLLRGINVGGKNKIRMSDLKALYENMGFLDIKTYIQSGNVIFSYPCKDKEALSENIQKEIIKKFGIQSIVLIKTKNEWQAVIKNNPYLNNSSIDISKLHVTFLLKKANQNAAKELKKI